MWASSARLSRRRAPGQYVQTTVSAPTTSYTVSAWLRWQGSLPISAIKVGLAYGDGSTNTLWMGYFSDGKLAVSNSSVDLKSATVVNSSTWHHVVGVVSGGNLAGYIDGVSVGSTATGARGANTLRMGDYLGSLPWTGLIDDVRVYNRPLSATEVLALYNASKTTKYKFLGINTWQRLDIKKRPCRLVDLRRLDHLRHDRDRQRQRGSQWHAHGRPGKSAGEARTRIAI